MSVNWRDASELSEELLRKGWSSPDTYTLGFQDPPETSGVYIFALHDAEDLRKAIVAYVGMSENIVKRWSGHEVLKEISVAGYWTKKWFKSVPFKRLRECELKNIRKYNPPWNIQGRTRGVSL